MNHSSKSCVVGVLATRAAILLPLFGVLWWYADLLRLATGWLHPQDFDNWHWLLFPLDHATVPFAHHPAFWGQISLSYLISTIWMFHELGLKRASIRWVLPAIMTFPVFFSALSSSSHFSDPAPFVCMLLAVVYAQPLAALIYSSKNRRTAIVQSIVAMTVLLSFGILTFSLEWKDKGMKDRPAAVERLLSYGVSPNARTADGKPLVPGLSQSEIVGNE